MNCADPHSIVFSVTPFDLRVIAIYKGIPGTSAAKEEIEVNSIIASAKANEMIIRMMA